MQQPKSLKANFLWNTFGSVVYFACQFAVSMLVVWLSDSSVAIEKNAVLSTAVAVTNVFITVASYGMRNYQVSDVHGKYPQSCYIRSRMYTCAAAVLACGAFTLAGAFASANPYSPYQCACIMLYLAYRLVEAFSDVYHGVDQKQGRMDIIGKSYVARGLLSVVSFSAVFLLTGHVGVTLAVMTAVNYAFFVVYDIPRARKLYEPQPVSAHLVLRLLWECAPLAVYTILNTTIASLSKIVLGLYLGGDALSMYSAVTGPVQFLQTAATYLFIPLIGTFSARYAHRDANAFWKIGGLITGVVLALIPAGWMFTAVAGEWCLAVFVKTAAVPYAYLLGPMVVVAVLSALILFFSMLLTVMRNMKGLLIANVLGLGVAALAIGPCIARWQLQGATIGTSAALCTQIICLLAFGVSGARRHFAQPQEEDAV